MHRVLALQNSPHALAAADGKIAIVGPYTTAVLPIAGLATQPVGQIHILRMKIPQPAGGE